MTHVLTGCGKKLFRGRSFRVRVPTSISIRTRFHRLGRFAARCLRRAKEALWTVERAVHRSFIFYGLHVASIDIHRLVSKPDESEESTKKRSAIR